MDRARPFNISGLKETCLTQTFTSLLNLKAPQLNVFGHEQHYPMEKQHQISPSLHWLGYVSVKNSKNSLTKPLSVTSILPPLCVVFICLMPFCLPSFPFQFQRLYWHDKSLHMHCPSIQNCTSYNQ